MIVVIVFSDMIYLLRTVMLNEYCSFLNIQLQLQIIHIDFVFVEVIT